jgi:hypothetical protein
MFSEKGGSCHFVESIDLIAHLLRIVTCKLVYDRC